MSFYIANSTQQRIKIQLRLPESVRPWVALIPAGQQIEIPHFKNGATTAMTDSVISQLERFGARNAKELKGRIKAFPGLIYAIDKPVSVENIEIGHEMVEEYQDRRAADEAVKSAKAMDVAMRDKRTGKRRAKTTEVEIEQELAPKTAPTGKEIAMKVAVAEDGARQ